MDWSPHVPAVSPPFPFIHEVTGDSDDACDRIITIASGSGTAYSCINVATANDGDSDDDARSCNYESRYIMGDANIEHKQKKDDDDDEDDHRDNDIDGTEYDCSGYSCRDYQFAHRERGFPDIILDSTPIDQEAMESSYEVVKGEDDMRRMEDKLFWETCLAIGYP